MFLGFPHGASGQSEDWSQVVEQLRRHRPVIRLNYAEPVARTDSANAPRVQKLLVTPILPKIFPKLCFRTLQQARRRQAKTP
jgi:hypothetical protein